MAGQHTLDQGVVFEVCQRWAHYDLRCSYLNKMQRIGEMFDAYRAIAPPTRLPHSGSSHMTLVDSLWRRALTTYRSARRSASCANSTAPIAKFRFRAGLQSTPRLAYARSCYSNYRTRAVRA